MGSCYSLNNDIYYQEPELLIWKHQFESIHLQSSDVVKFCKLYRLSNKTNSTETCLTGSLYIRGFLDSIDADPIMFMYKILSVFKIGSEQNVIFNNFCEFCFALWNFGTLDQNLLGNLYNL